MLNTLNEQLFFFINGAAGHSQVLDQFFLFVTTVFVPALVALPLLWFLFVIPRRSRTIKEKSISYQRGGVFVLSLSIVWILVELIKGAVSFPRPQQLLSGIHVLSRFGSFDSFPSAHTAFAFAAASVVYHYSRSAGILMFLLATLVGVSRIFVGVHFPLDVLAGAAIGCIIPVVLIEVFRRYTY